jgi:hypothetical protein
MMNKLLLKRLAAVVVLITVLTSCKPDQKNQITGTWQVVDVRFESKAHIDPELLSFSETEIKSWIYTFNADSTMNVKQSDRDIPNRWKLNQKGDSIIIGFGHGFFDVSSKIEKLTDEEMVIRTSMGADTAKVTQTLYLSKQKK